MQKLKPIIKLQTLLLAGLVHKNQSIRETCDTTVMRLYKNIIDGQEPLDKSLQLPHLRKYLIA